MLMSPIRDALSNFKIVLASSSPQRKAILEQIGLKFAITPSPFDEETVQKDSFKNPKDYVKCVAHEKAKAVAELHRGDTSIKVVVIGADTVIIHKDRIIGKPHKAEVAITTLRELSGHTHSVCTGVSVMKVQNGDVTETIFHEETTVVFGDLTEDDITSYVETGEPLNKAGSYGIQGKGAMLVSGIKGDYNNVVGFPAYRFCKEAIKFLKER